MLHGPPGYVWVDAGQVAALAHFRGESVAAFTRQFVRQVGTRLSLIEKPNGDCAFWDRGHGCTVYEARPIQCRTWPFWPERVETPAAWGRTCRSCPGAGQGACHSAAEITEAALRTHRNRP